MGLLTDGQRAFAAAIASLAYCNPFLPGRIEAERDALGSDFVARGAVWHAEADLQPRHPNVVKLGQQAETLADEVRRHLLGGGGGTAEELALYQDVVLYLLYYRYEEDLYRLIVERHDADRPVAFYQRFAGDFDHYLGVSARARASCGSAAHVFAGLFQIRRAFHFTFRNIIGGSMPAARLRAAVWQSVFSHDLRRYRRSLYERMGDITTLITGPSGTGKELVARAIALSRYIPFDPEKQVFVRDFAGSFYALNVSALSPTLIESELFGHKRGAFTGAIQDRVGWLEVCPPVGTVFLDEIAEIDVSIQVKLLRVLQTRTFQRLGETRERRFQGKIVAATNRDLAAEMRAERFREDLYYRLCGDRIDTPSLEEQLRDAPGELHNLLRFVATRIVGEAEAGEVSEDAERWIIKHLGDNYRWPGNVRELEQCVRNIMIRSEYRPTQLGERGALEELVQAVRDSSLSAEQLLRAYCTLVYARTGSYLETARRLRLDRRTVRDRIDPEILSRVRGTIRTEAAAEGRRQAKR